MFRKTKELQSLVNASRKNLKDAERKVEDRNILIADLQKENEELLNKNIAVYEENEEQKELIDRIKRIATSNAYNNEKAILGKIKELILDAENQN